MSVFDLLRMCTDDSVVIQIWDQHEEEIVFVGTINEAMYVSDYAEYDVDSYDLCDQGMIVNIDTSDYE